MSDDERADLMFPDAPAVGMGNRRVKTINLERESKADRAVVDLLYPERGFWRPQKRSDCAQVTRPCPYIGCRHNMYADQGRGDATITFNFPDLEPWDVKPTASCALDIIEDQGPMTLVDVGRVLGVTRERIRQIERRAFEVALKSLPKEEREELREAIERLCRAEGHNWDHAE